jgi:hypothetical protein
MIVGERTLRNKIPETLKSGCLGAYSTTISLLGLALGFSALGLLIVAKEHDGGASITGGILGILLGAAFLIAACLHWKCGDQIQGGFRVEEVPSVEIVSEMRQAANTICSF